MVNAFVCKGGGEGIGNSNQTGSTAFSPVASAAAGFFLPDSEAASNSKDMALSEAGVPGAACASAVSVFIGVFGTTGASCCFSTATASVATAAALSSGP